MGRRDVRDFVSPSPLIVPEDIRIGDIGTIGLRTLVGMGAGSLDSRMSAAASAKRTLDAPRTSVGSYVQRVTEDTECYLYLADAEEASIETAMVGDAIQPESDVLQADVAFWSAGRTRHRSVHGICIHLMTTCLSCHRKANVNFEGDSMQLIVAGIQNDNDVSLHRSSPDEAQRKARELEANGLNAVSISHITGRTYEPVEFDACFVRMFK